MHVASSFRAAASGLTIALIAVLAGCSSADGTAGAGPFAPPVLGVTVGVPAGAPGVADTARHTIHEVVGHKNYPHYPQPNARREGRGR